LLPAHEFHEEIERVLPYKKAAVNADVAGLALDNAHAVAFHSGLGAALNPSPSAPFNKYVNEEYVSSFADVVYSKPNIAVVADGAGAQSVSKWVDQFFKGVPAAARSGQTLKTEATKYFGGEQRTSHASGNSIVIAFPGSDSTGSKPEIEVLATLLGAQPTIKWAPGFSLLSKATAGTPGVSVASANQAYSDAGLLTVQLTGAAASVRKAAEETVKALKSIAAGTVSKEDVAKAIANAKFNLLEKAQTRGASVLQAGSGLVNNGKVQDLVALSKSLDAVTADKLKTVSRSFEFLFLLMLEYTNMNVSLSRLPRPFSMERPQSLPLATCLCCLMLRSWVCGYRKGVIKA
jgi:ubiquinol-cytochrome c reductase core subunit 2